MSNDSKKKNSRISIKVDVVIRIDTTPYRVDRLYILRSYFLREGAR